MSNTEKMVEREHNWATLSCSYIKSYR